MESKTPSRLSREANRLLVVCETDAQAQALYDGVEVALSGTRGEDQEGDVFARLQGATLVLSGDLKLAEDAIQVALDADLELPDVEGLWVAP